jgi:hypothetical protein
MHSILTQAGRSLKLKSRTAWSTLEILFKTPSAIKSLKPKKKKTKKTKKKRRKMGVGGVRGVGGNAGAGEMAQQLSGYFSKHSGFNFSIHVVAYNNKLEPQGLRGYWASIVHRHGCGQKSVCIK